MVLKYTRLLPFLPVIIGKASKIHINLSLTRFPLNITVEEMH